MPLPYNPEAELKRLLKGAQLVRSKKHNVYRLPNGKLVSMSHTPSDLNAVRNQLRSVERALGLRDGLGKPGTRRTKTPTPPAQALTMAVQIWTSGGAGSRTLQDSLKNALKEAH